MSDNVIESFLIGLGFDFNEQDTRRLTHNFTRVSAGLKKISSAAIAVTAAVGAALVAPINDLRKLKFDAEILGISVDKLGAFTSGFKQFGVTANTTTGALKRFAAVQATFIEGSGLQHDTETLRKLHEFARNAKIDMDPLALLRSGDPEALLFAIADGLANVKDASLRLKLAKNLGVEELLPALSKGSIPLKAEIDEQAKKGGPTQAQADAANRLWKRWDSIKTKFGEITRELQGALFPVMEKYMEKFLSWFSREDIAKKIGDLADKFVELHGHLWLIGFILAGPIASALSKVTAGFGLLGAGLTTVLSVTRLLPAALIGLARLIPGVAAALGLFELGGEVKEGWDESEGMSKNDRAKMIALSIGEEVNSWGEALAGMLGAEGVEEFFGDRIKKSAEYKDVLVRTQESRDDLQDTQGVNGKSKVIYNGGQVFSFNMPEGTDREQFEAFTDYLKQHAIELIQYTEPSTVRSD